MSASARPALALALSLGVLACASPAGGASGGEPPARPADPAAAKEALQRANHLLGAGKTQEAIPLLRQAAAQDPKSPLIQFTLGSALLHVKDYDGAIQALRAGLTLAPSNLLARRALATAQQKKGDLPAARATLEALWGEAPTFRPAGEDLAELLAGQGDRRGAIEIYQHLIATYGPTDDVHLAALYRRLGKVLEADGDRQAALAAYQETLRINPKDGAARAAIQRLSR